MGNNKYWEPTKIIKTKRGYAPSNNTKYVDSGSLLMCDILIKTDKPIIRKHAKGLLPDVGCGHEGFAFDSKEIK